VLESMCAAKAANRITDQGIVDLTALGDRMTRAVADGDDLEYAELDDALHRLIRELSGQQTATLIIERLRVLNIRHHFRMTRPPAVRRRHSRHTCGSSRPSPTATLRRRVRR
jgi:DNA-binding GntR family transcriptional regulator